MDVQNKSAMITGGAIGLGYKYSEILLRNGARAVAIIDLPTSNGDNAVATLEKEFGKGRVMFVACDVTNHEDFKKAFQKVINTFQVLDIVVNNAGIFNEKQWKETIDINVTAVISSSLLALNYMGKHKGGKGGVIVNIASIFGLMTGYISPVYCASKHAVLGFSQSLAESYDKTGIRVVILCPGLTTTALIANIKVKLPDFVDSSTIDYVLSKIKPQATDNVALALLNLIRKGKNGAVWISADEQPPRDVEFPHYSTRTKPILDLAD